MEENNNVMRQYEYDEMIESINLKANTGLGVVLGIVLGIIGAVLWAAVVKYTGYNIGIVAIAIGYMVSEGFVRAGRGTKKSVGVIAGLIALLSIFLGEVLTIIVAVAEYLEISMWMTLQNIDFMKLPQLMLESSKPIKIIFYIIALKAAYRRSFIDESKFNVMIDPNSISNNIF